MTSQKIYVVGFLAFFLCSIVNAEEFHESAQAAQQGVVVVKVFSEGRDPRDGKQWFTNTGSVVGDEGEVLTSLMTVSGAEKIRVAKLDGETFAAKPIGFHQPTGLVLLNTEFEDKGLDLSENSPRLGDEVLFASVRAPDVSDGGLILRPTVISSVQAKVRCFGVNHEDMAVVNMDCPTGAASAPILNDKGEIAGAILSGMQTKADGGYFYFIPAPRLQEIVDQLREGKSVRTGWVGLAISGSSENEGITVQGVLSGSPAHEAGMRPGDIVVGINGENVRAPMEFTPHVTGARPGTNLSVEIQRDLQMQTVNIEVGKRPLRIRRVESKTPQKTAKTNPTSSSHLQFHPSSPSEIQREIQILKTRLETLESQLPEAEDNTDNHN